MSKARASFPQLSSEAQRWWRVKNHCKSGLTSERGWLPTGGASCRVVSPCGWAKWTISDKSPFHGLQCMLSSEAAETSPLRWEESPQTRAGPRVNSWGQLPSSLALGWQPGLFFLSIWVQPMNFHPNQPNHIHIYCLLFCYRKATPPYLLQILRGCQNHPAVAMISPWSLHSSGICQIYLLGLKEKFGLLIPQRNGSIGRSACWAWFRSNPQALKGSWKGSGSEPQTSGTLLCLLWDLFMGVEGSISCRTGVCNSPHCPSWGRCSPLFSELLPETIFVDIGLPTQGVKLLRNVYKDHLKPEKRMFLVMQKEPNTLEDKYSSFTN